MKALILGASGLVGGNALQYFKAKNWKVVGTHFSFETPDTKFFNTLEITKREEELFESFEPDVVLHAGALTHVDYCESHQQESYQKTVQSTINVISLAKKYNVKVAYISTDYVFDGMNGPYLEDAPVNPISVYGKHKLEAEQLIQELPKHLIIRITNVYGDEIRNKNFVSRIIEQVKNQSLNKLILPCDQFATPVNALDIARALYLLLDDQKNGLYHIASTDYVNRVQLAQKVLRFFPDYAYELIPKQTANLNQAAKRPLNSGLLAHKFLREYPWFNFTSVEQYVALKVGQRVSMT